LKLELQLVTIKSDSLIKVIDNPITKNIATGGLPPEFFLGTVLFMILILIFLLIIKIKEMEKE